MFSFTIFRIPVQVQPWFWATSFFLGGGLWMRDRLDFASTAIWMIVVFVSILIHELGHAVTSRRLTGAQPSIALVAFGGLAYPNTSLTRDQSLKVSLAGPAAGFLFALLPILFCLIKFGPQDGWQLVIELLNPLQGLSLVSQVHYFSLPFAGRVLLMHLLWVNIFWGLINLLPIYPLDGGQAYAALEPSRKKVHQVGFVTGLVTAIFGLVLSSFLIVILFGLLAWQNYQAMQGGVR